MVKISELGLDNLIHGLALAPGTVLPVALSPVFVFQGPLCVHKHRPLPLLCPGVFVVSGAFDAFVIQSLARI